MIDSKFNSERDELSKEEMQAMDILTKVHDHKLTPFQGLQEMTKLIEAEEVESVIA